MSDREARTTIKEVRGMDANMDTTDAGINESTWDVDGSKVRIITADRIDERAPMSVTMQMQSLMSLLECTQVEAEHVLRILQEDGEFITSVHADIDAL